MGSTLQRKRSATEIIWPGPAQRIAGWLCPLITMNFTDSSPMSAKFPEPSICSSVRRSENTILVGPLSHCLSHSGMALTFWMGRQSTWECWVLGFSGPILIQNDHSSVIWRPYSIPNSLVYHGLIQHMATWYCIDTAKKWWVSHSYVYSRIKKSSNFPTLAPNV